MGKGGGKTERDEVKGSEEIWRGEKGGGRMTEKGRIGGGGGREGKEVIIKRQDSN